MRLAVVGTGYVGLVSAACFAEMGNIVTCVDVKQSVIDLLNSGKIHIYEPGLAPMVERCHADKRLLFTTKLEEALKGANVAFIAVGTPPGEDGSADLQYVKAAAAQIGELMQNDIIVVDKSTVPVGTADCVRQIISEKLAERKVSYSFSVVSNPEFLKEGAAIDDFMKPDRVVIGTDSEEAAEVMRELYEPFARTRNKLIVMSIRSAEMTKYAANCMLATKISFINEIAGICEQVGADVREVRTGIGSDSRIGYQFIYPGIGFGGSCFPKDVKALIKIGKDVGLPVSLLSSVEAVNKKQKIHLAEMIERYFEPQGGLAGKTLAIWGLAFKARTDDMRESASIDTINYLSERGMKIRAFDPVAANNARRIFEGNANIEIIDDQYAVCEGADSLAVLTEWNQFRNPDFDQVKTLLTAPLIFDGRNLYSPSAMARRGYAYFCIGRKNS